MKVEIVSKEQNKLLNRLEVMFKVQFDKETTPARDSVREELEKSLKAKSKVLVIDYMKTEFGKREARGYAKVYASQEDASRLERRHILRRNRLLEAD